VDEAIEFGIGGVMEVVEYLTRWGHYIFGITWIGLLYYFNLIQGGYMAAASNEAKVEAFTKLVPNALWYFRWGAMLTFLTGLVLLEAVWRTGRLGIDIAVGATMGTLMFLNVWLIIWPNQKIVIASNEAVAAGGEADPGQAGAAATALLASRTNTLFSLPMLFFMGSSFHFQQGPGLLDNISAPGLIVAMIIILALEANAIWGKLSVITTVKGVIHSSLILTAALWAAVALL